MANYLLSAERVRLLEREPASITPASIKVFKHPLITCLLGISGDQMELIVNGSKERKNR